MGKKRERDRKGESKRGKEGARNVKYVCDAASHCFSIIPNTSKNATPQRPKAQSQNNLATNFITLGHLGPQQTARREKILDQLVTLHAVAAANGQCLRISLHVLEFWLNSQVEVC